MQIAASNELLLITLGGIQSQLYMRNVIAIGWQGTKVPARQTAVPSWKRCLDLACVLFAIPAIVPLFVMIGAWIKLVSRGPIFFRQERVGLRGRRFICFKFRSMKKGADTTVHKDYFKELIHSGTTIMTKMDSKGDTRLIPLGSFLRATALDELPQLINVLRGEMSLVGPRPCIPYEYEEYLPWQKERFNALPGLTGLWQVSGKNRTTFNEMVHLDIEYGRMKSLSLDLKIMFMTLPVLLSQVRESRARRRTSPAK